jgi:hypothetical protein
MEVNQECRLDMEKTEKADEGAVLPPRGDRRRVSLRCFHRYLRPKRCSLLVVFFSSVYVLPGVVGMSPNAAVYYPRKGDRAIIF